MPPAQLVSASVRCPSWQFPFDYGSISGHKSYRQIACWFTSWIPLLGTASFSLHWRHNVGDGVSNHRHFDCLINHLFRRRSKKTWKLQVTGLCEGNPPITGGFPSQRTTNAENVHFDDVIICSGINALKCEITKQKRGNVSLSQLNVYISMCRNPLY